MLWKTYYCNHSLDWKMLVSVVTQVLSSMEKANLLLVNHSIPYCSKENAG